MGQCLSAANAAVDVLVPQDGTQNVAATRYDEHKKARACSSCLHAALLPPACTCCACSRHRLATPKPLTPASPAASHFPHPP